MANAVYSNARAKALERTLLGRERLYRMAESSSAEDALKILSEVNFGDGLSIGDVSEFETLIKVEEKNLFEFVKETCPDKNFIKFLLVKNDFHNAEALIKAKYLKISSEKMLVENGIFDKDFLKEKIMVDEYKDFPKELADALLTCDEAFVSEKATGAFIGNTIKKAYYSYLYDLSKKNKDLKVIFSFKADCINVSTALRSRDFNAVKDSFIQGGTLTLSDLRFLAEESFESIKEKFKFGKLGEYILLAAESIEKGAPLSDFEKKADSFALEYLQKYKYSSENIYPFMLFVYYKLAELQNVRIVLIGLLNGLPQTEIKGRLRVNYVG